MRFNFALISTAIIGIHQIMAAPASPSLPSTSISQSISNSDHRSATPAGTIPNLAASTPTVLSILEQMGGGAIMLDEELVQELGWNQKDTDLLTGFLEAIEKLGDLTMQAYDPVTRKLLIDFQTEARELMARSGYKFELSNDGTNRRVLTRVTADDVTDILNKGVMQLLSIPDLVEQLVQSLTSCLDNLKKRADAGSFIAQKIYGIVNSLLTSLGNVIADKLFGSSKSASPPASDTSPQPNIPTPNLPLLYRTFLQ